MPATSLQQLNLMRAALACKTKKRCPSKKIEKVADSMSKRSLKDFASTNPKGLPKYATAKENFLGFQGFANYLQLQENNQKA